MCSPTSDHLGWREKSNVSIRGGVGWEGGWGGGGENDFCEALRVRCLQPDLQAFGLEGEVKCEAKGVCVWGGGGDDSND